MAIINEEALIQKLHFSPVVEKVLIQWSRNKTLDNKYGKLLDDMVNDQRLPEWVTCSECGHKHGGEPRNVRVQITDAIYLVPHTKIKEAQ